MNDEIKAYSITNEYMRSNYVKTLSYELIENVLYFLCIYPIASFINYYMYKNEIMLYLNLITIIPIFLVTYLRVTIKKKINFILSIFGVIAVSLIIIGGILEQYLFLVILIFWIINSIKKYSHKQIVKFDKSEFIVLQLLLMPQIIIIASMNLKGLEIFTVIIAVIIMLISMGYICKLRNTRLSMDDTKNKRSNKKDINIFIAGIMLLISILITSLYTLGIFQVTYNLNKNLINNVINIFYVTTDSFTCQRSNGGFLLTNTHTKLSKSVPLFNGEKTLSIGYQILMGVLIVAISIILIATIVLVSYITINIILIHIKKLRNKEKISFVFNNNEHEFVKKENKIRVNIRNVIFLNNKEKIRKLYKDKILKYKKDNIDVNNFFSTDEIQKEVLSKVNDNIEDVTRVYEKARYSNEEITKDDIEIIKNKSR